MRRRNKNEKSKNLTFDELVLGSYYIPTYQRPYGWGLDICENFVKDLCDSEVDLIEGQIAVYKNVLKDREIEEVVDGQQRITSSYLLFCALYTIVSNYKGIKWGDLENCEQEIIKSFRKRARGKNNQLLEEVLDDSYFNEDCAITPNLTQKNKFEEFLSLFEEHSKGNKKISFNDILRKNVFIRNYEFFFKYFSSFDRNDLILCIDNIFETDTNVAYIANNPVERFMRLNQGHMPFELCDFIKTVFFTTEGGFEAEENEEKNWLAIIDNIELLLENTTGRTFSFDNVFTWFLINSGKKYRVHLKDIRSDVKKVSWNKNYEVVSELIKDNGDRFEVLHNFKEFTDKVVESVIGENNVWDKIKDVEILGVFNGSGTQHYTTYLLTNGVEEETQKRIVKEILIPHFTRRMIMSERKIGQDMGLDTAILPFYDYMEDNCEEDMYSRYANFFFDNEDKSKTPSLVSISESDMVFNKYGNIARVLMLLHGTGGLSLEHIVSQRYVQEKSEFDYFNEKLGGKFNDYSELETCVNHLGNFTLLPTKQNSKLRDKLPGDKLELLKTNGLWISDGGFVKDIENNCLNARSIKHRGEELLNMILNMKQIKSPLKENRVEIIIDNVENIDSIDSNLIENEYK